MQIEWNKFQSLLALVRMLGGDATLAWTLQLMLTAITAIVSKICGGTTAPHSSRKQPSKAAAVLLATPYVYLYDLTALAVSAGFLIRYALATGFMPAKAIGLATGSRGCF